MSAEPTLGEVMRQVEALVGQVRDLVKEVRSDYVRRDLYEARHTHVNRRVDDVEKDVQAIKDDVAEKERERRGFNRQVLGGFIVAMLVMLTQLAITAVSITGGIR